MRKKTFASLIMLGAAVAGTAFAQATTTTTSFTSTQKTEIEKVVHDYLIKNPEVIVQAVQVLQQKQMDQARQSIEKTHQVAPTLTEALFHNSADPMAGNPNGVVTVVEFFDYQCRHCVDMTPVLDAIIKSNNKVKIVYKEFPIRGPLSEFASKAALAAQKQGKYYEFHTALMKNSQPLSEDLILNVAKNAGLDVQRLKTDMNSKEITDQIKANYQLAQNLQLIGTPAFFIAKTNIAKNATKDSIVFVPGELSEKELQSIIDKTAS